jgi:hypothetical protein
MASYGCIGVYGDTLGTRQSQLGKTSETTRMLQRERAVMTDLARSSLMPALPWGPYGARADCLLVRHPW